MKEFHEFRDPIHGFIHVNDVELRVIDTPPIQRLRDIHQLALTSYIYPGATHRRFEHSLGVMELAGRIFDRLANPLNVTDGIRDTLQPLFSNGSSGYWRSVVRVAALCHDIGHAPFSHAAEELFPLDGEGRRIKHEQITRKLILSDEMESVWEEFDPPLRGLDIADIATGDFVDPKKQLLKEILSEIVIGDVFGADRIDYLLRDSFHAGVSYGRFDHDRMLETLRILEPNSTDQEARHRLSIGIEAGGIRTAEGLLLARYFMWDQVYLHRKRRILDHHLKMYMKPFLKELYETPYFSADTSLHLKLTDAEIITAMRLASQDSGTAGHDDARRIIERDPFKWIWSPDPVELEKNPNLGEELRVGLASFLGDEQEVVHDVVPPSGFPDDFLARKRDGESVSAFSMSRVLQSLPSASFDAIFVRPDLVTAAKQWLKDNLEEISQRAPSEREEE